MSTTPTKTASSTPRKAAPRRAAATRKAAPAATSKKDKQGKVKKPKLVRGSFTVPKDEYAALAELKQRCAKLTRPAKKSELLRAGIKLLAGLDGAALLSALKAVPTIKTGRPKKN